MKTFAAADLQRNPAEIQKAALTEPIFLTYHDKPRYVMMSLEEFVRIKGKRVMATPDAFPESVAARLREIANAYPNAGHEIAGGLADVQTTSTLPDGPSKIETTIALRTNDRKALAIKLAVKALRDLKAMGVHAWVVGSLAKGNFSLHSDVDFAVDCSADLEYEVFRTIEKAMGSFPFHMVPCRRIEEDARPFMMEGAADASILIARQAQI
jgi:predicted nucleotidyltransferase